MTSRRAAVGWGALFGFLCLLMLVVGLESALHFLGPAIDGPFQLYNSLRRIWVGQQAGVDFQFFHGLGIPYLHYPFFRLFGGGFIASEITRQLVSTILYPIVVVVFLHFYLRDWTRTLAWSAIVIAGSIALRLTSILVAVNSLLGVRSTLPTLLPVVLCLPIRRWMRTALAAITLGGAFLFGTEQGMAAALALVIVTAVVAIRSPERRDYLVDGAAAVVGGVVVLMIGLMMIGGVSGMRGALAYNFKYVPMDQYWYFGSPPNHFIASWSMFPSLAATLWRIPIVLVLGVVAVVVWLRRVWQQAGSPAERREFALAVGLTYGLISCASLLGTWVNAYIQPLLRMMLLTGAVYLSTWLTERDAAMNRPRTGGVGRSTIGVAIATVAMMLAIVPSTFATTRLTIPHFFGDHIFGRKGATYSGIWMTTIPAGQAMLDAHRGPDGKPPTLWSTYAGLLEARNGLFQPNFDYIIHALGPDNRARYLSEFDRVAPQLVQTVHPLYTQYEAWIENTSWDFYARLLEKYDVVGNTDWSLFWAPRAGPPLRPQLAWRTAVQPDVDGVQLPVIRGPANAKALLQIEIEYEARNPLHVLPVIGSMPRYLIQAQNAIQKDPVTIDPYVTRTRFPLIVGGGQRPILHWGVFGLLPGASLVVKSITVYVVPMSPANHVWFDALVDSQLREMTQ
jgi:hypothetical protein